MRPKDKQYKDLYGIWYVATQLKDSSQEAIKELSRLSTKYLPWSRTFCTNLECWLHKAIPSDWLYLESQDRHGLLKRKSLCRPHRNVGLQLVIIILLFHIFICSKYEEQCKIWNKGRSSETTFFGIIFQQLYG